MPSARPVGGQSDHKSTQNLRPSPSTVGQSTPQKTISELFAASKHSVHNRGAEDITDSFPNKKAKHHHCSVERGETPLGQRIMQVDQMYNFTQKPARQVSEVIDLTGGSQSGSPLRKRPNGFRSANSTSKGGPKKIPVLNLRTTSKTAPDEYYQHVWNQLDAALSAIFAEKKLPYSMEELYKGVETACRQNRASNLNIRLCERCSSHMSSKVKPSLLQKMRVESSIEALDSIIKAWSSWYKQLKTIRSIFFYLDRSYLLHTSSLPSIEEMGYSQFRTHVFLETNIQRRLLQGACDLVNNDRRGDRSRDGETLLRSTVDMFHSLTTYSEFFEPKLMANSDEYYSAWAKDQISKSDLAGYVEGCGKLISDELTRCETYGLDETTRKSLEAHLEDILIDERHDRLLMVQDVGILLQNDSRGTLSQLFSLLQRRNLGEKLRPAFEAFITNQGSEIVFDEKREQEMVTRLLRFKQELDQIWEHSFRRHEGLGHSLREAFETFINQSKRSSMTWGTDNPKPGERIAKYVDMVLKGGSKAIRATGTGLEDGSKVPDNEDQVASSEDEDVEIGKQLDQVLDLFRFVHGKAVFEAFYKRDLARRLLLGRSASSDSEKSMLTRLKSECGAGFTYNLEQMFKDIEMAREEISSYKSTLEERQIQPTFDLSVNVLSASAWPSYPEVIVNVPEHILKATASFEQHYKMKHTGRKLEWKHALAHCQLKAIFPKGSKEIVVSCFQAVIMMSFNDTETMTYSDLQAASGLDDTELKRTLQSLACARYRVLSKSPKGKEVNNHDTFTINLAFAHPKYRIKINQIQAKETKAENQQTHERVAADRNYETQAAIVRIMKSRKKITHAELISEVITATKSRGVLDPADIKKNIEKLIDKDYMERDDEGHNTYNYVA